MKKRTNAEKNEDKHKSSSCNDPRRYDYKRLNTKEFFFLSKKVTTITTKPHNLTSSMTHTDQATDKNDPTYYHIMQLDEACDNQLDKQNDYPPNTRKTTPRR